MGWGWIAALAAVALFYALLKRRKAKPTPPPMHRPFALPDWMNDPVRPEPRRSTPNPAQRLPGTFRMAYVDVNGEETVRDIEDPKAERIGRELYVEAWCHLRNDRRTFRADRIRWLEADTGARVLDPVKFFASKAPVPLEETPEYIAHKKAMTRVLPGLKALTWLARTDRDVDAEEMAVLLSYIPARIALTKGASDWNEHFARAWIDDANPTKADALKALSEMPPGSKQADLFKACAARIVLTNGAPDRLKENRRQQLMKVMP
ncbi:WYL domain-containing protein [Aureimonas ureilytica]|nr:WYL domain-containing protein [Aureimonas ureilytica]